MPGWKSKPTKTKRWLQADLLACILLQKCYLCCVLFWLSSSEPELRLQWAEWWNLAAASPCPHLAHVCLGCSAGTLLLIPWLQYQFSRCQPIVLVHRPKLQPFWGLCAIFKRLSPPPALAKPGHLVALCICLSWFTGEREQPLLDAYSPELLWFESTTRFPSWQLPR